MIRPDDEGIHGQAIAWHVRLADASEEDWGEFAAWLEADARHNDAYEAVCDEDLALSPAVALARQENFRTEAEAGHRDAAVSPIERGGPDAGCGGPWRRPWRLSPPGHGWPWEDGTGPTP